jgi:hypothetical protein
MIRVGTGQGIRGLGPSRVPEQLNQHEQGEQAGRPDQEGQNSNKSPFEDAERKHGDAFSLPIESG